MIGAEFHVNTYTVASQYDPSVTGLSNGGFVVTWTGEEDSYEPGFYFTGIYGQCYDAGGNPAGSEFQVNTTTAGSQSDSNLTALNDGGFVVTWTSGPDDVGGIYGQCYDASGNPTGSEFHVNTYTTDIQRASSVTALNDGGFVVTWESFSQDGFGFGIYGQRFHADGTPYRDFTGTAGNDTWVGGAGNDIISGLAGNDFLYGIAGNDILNGGAGNDYLNGGLGSDYASYTTATSAVSVNLNLPAPQNTGGAGIDTLVGIENVLGSNYNDKLTGNAAANVLNGGAGADTMSGGSGNDTYYVDAAGDVTTETSSANGYDTVISSVSHTLGNYLERLILQGTAYAGNGNMLNNALYGHSGNNSLSGDAGNDTLYGNAGNDILNGGVGVDSMLGGTGNDTYLVNNPSDTATETSAADGYDTVVSTVSRGLGNYLEKLVLSGTASISGYGNVLDNSITGNTREQFPLWICRQRFSQWRGGKRPSRWRKWQRRSDWWNWY